MVAEADYRIKLPVFEGPLDLLLFLIRKSELDIYDIPIESVTRQYLDALYGMKEMQIEVAGEFFVMAATLMEIKSRMLLPRHQQAVDMATDEEELDPRWELVHQLIQYKKFKEAAATLGAMARDAQDRLGRPEAATAAALERPLKHVDRIELWNSFNLILRRLAEKLVVGEIHAEHTTVSDQMEYILEAAKSRKVFTFSSLFTEKISLRTLVATFLAMLELTRLKKLTLQQDEAFADIVCTVVDETAPVTPTVPTEPPTDRNIAAEAAPAAIVTDAALSATEPALPPVDASASAESAPAEAMASLPPAPEAALPAADSPLVPPPAESPASVEPTVVPAAEAAPAMEASEAPAPLESPAQPIAPDAPAPMPADSPAPDSAAPAVAADQNALETPAQPRTVSPNHEETVPPPGQGQG